MYFSFTIPLLLTVVKVSDVSVTPRTAKECETKWLGDRHPKINRGTWSNEETAQLTELARSYGENRVNWKEVAQKLDVSIWPPASGDRFD